MPNICYSPFEAKRGIATVHGWYFVHQMPLFGRHPQFRAAAILLAAGAWLIPSTPVSAQWWWQRDQPRRGQPHSETPAATPSPTKTRRAIAPAPAAAQRPSPVAPAHAPLPEYELEPGPAGFATVVFDFSSTVDALARACDLPTSALLAGNRLTRGELRAGQMLRLPAPAWMAPGGGDPPSGTPACMLVDTGTTDDLAREVWRGVRGRKRVALTFDAGGGRDGAEELVRVLRESDASPTFFMTGQFARRFPDTAAELAQLGRVFNHSDTHPDFTSITVEAMRIQLARAEESVSAVTGESTRPFWRPPYGARNRHALRTAAGEGYRSIYWTVDSLDAYQKGIDADSIVDNVLRPRAGRRDPDHHLDGAVILMHVGIKETPKALPRIIGELRRSGFELVTVEEILRP